MLSLSVHFVSFLLLSCLKWELNVSVSVLQSCTITSTMEGSDEENEGL